MNTRHSTIAILWTGYVAFVIYGSLLPFDFRPLPLDAAWSAFQQAPMLRLGVASRADWIANGVLYVPVGFLTVWLLAGVAGKTRGEVPVAPGLGLAVIAGLFGVFLAVAVEFAQVFFPPRTVSLNDLLAEVIGSSVGVIAASLSPAWVYTFFHARHLDPAKVAWAGVEAFLVAYVAFSLFPYDVLVSLDELAQKAHGGDWGLWLAGEAPLDLQGGFKLCAEALLTLPFGIYFGHRRGPHRASFAQAALLGALLGAALELAQFFTASGVSQGASVVTRMIGTCAGLAIWRRRESFSADGLALTLRRHGVAATCVYLAVLFLANGGLADRWRGIGFAASRLGEVNFLPFYYHYYTTEARALLSLASVILMYLPVGILAWARRAPSARAIGLAAVLALAVEAMKLFLQGNHPDPTHILLAGLAAAIGQHGMQWLAETLTKTAQTASAERLAPELAVPISAHGGASGPWTALVAMLAVLAFCMYRALTFPSIPVIVATILAVSAAGVWRRPARAFFLIPLALPVFDLAPWSGRFFFDEFDLLVLTCLAVGYVRIPAPPRDLPPDPAFPACRALVVASLLVSTGIALWPWPLPDANAFTSYLSPFNALRIVKGAIEAFFCTQLMRRLHAHGSDAIRPWALGMTAGLALTVAAIVWERIAFAGLFDVTSDYRVAGPISAMHVGGAYIECFLVVALPFLLLVMLQTQSRTNRALGLALLVAATYALMVTYSRAGYAAYGIALGLFLFLAGARSRQARRRAGLAVLLALVAVGTAIPVLTGPYAQQRLSRIARDFSIRQAHWRDVLDLRSPGPVTSLFGMGLGRFPETRYLLGRETTRTGSYQLRAEDGNTFLRLTPGRPLYVEQIVPVEPGQRYRLTLDVRSPAPGAIGLSLCEKWLLASFDCQWLHVTIPAGGNVWSHVDLSVETAHLTRSPWYARKPVKLALHTPPRGAREVDVDNLRLEAANEGDLLQNGDFANAMDHWFFTSDNHLEWRAHNVALTVFFDQGWAGLLSLAALLALAIRRAGGSAWRGDLNSAAVLSALAGFLLVGMFDTLIDAPRFFFLLLALATIVPHGRGAAIVRSTAQ